MESKNAQKFLEVGIDYCNLVETSLADNSHNKLSQLLLCASSLYNQVQLLPEVEDENLDITIADFNLELPKVVFAQNEIYWEVFEPYQLEEPMCGSLTDDILGIYRDVKEGVLLYQKGDQTEAIWHWKFSFETHWGRHATSAIRAIHSLQF